MVLVETKLVMKELNEMFKIRHNVHYCGEDFDTPEWLSNFNADDPANYDDLDDLTREQLLEGIKIVLRKRSLIEERCREIFKILAGTNMF